MSGAPGVSSVSVVIPAHDAPDTIGEQLEAIRAQDAEWIDEVVVVDSMSTDTTVPVVRQFADWWPKVRLIAAPRPGANTARNAGVADTATDAVLLCDADDVVDINWSAALFAGLQDHDVVRGRYSVRLLNEPDVIAARGSLASTSAPEVSEQFGGLGGNCGFRRGAWERLGGLLEHHYGSDDIEFFWRARLAGMEVGYIDSAVVNYRLRPGMHALFRQQMTWASGRALLLKEFADTGLMTGRPVRLALKSWAWLAIHLPDAVSQDPGRRGQWVRGAANAAGRVRGSVKHRVLYL